MSQVSVYFDESDLDSFFTIIPLTPLNWAQDLNTHSSSHYMESTRLEKIIFSKLED